MAMSDRKSSPAAYKRALAEAWGDYLDRHRDEIAENFERAAELIRAGDTHGLAEHVGRNRRARAEAAASDSHAATTPVLVEYQGQLATGYVIRSFCFMRRVRVDSTGGYFLAWVPSWRVSHA